MLSAASFQEKRGRDFRTARGRRGNASLLFIKGIPSLARALLLSFSRIVLLGGKGLRAGLCSRNAGSRPASTEGKDLFGGDGGGGSSEKGKLGGGKGESKGEMRTFVGPFRRGGGPTLATTKKGKRGKKERDERTTGENVVLPLY